ncbi:hypothetical protein ASPZODRAFT_13981 [Penicilliopsis zonata CBS 506.65]|uniref:CCHC-type domain-containing protein n=1 Tax=Penicilliopsis zonata CBS 506.65 TaxID=1073090 RepID=A0A1L9SQ61_9EURO|nr:hypothetical protein ASPZODRAFT_13981 [Penicilliopsis zonata CBS 506.65]OJJ49256.1 hypothetical protein ASPZODRAFT_13981 [Penicilliopsis zonata CBS 506.65]
MPDSPGDDQDSRTASVGVQRARAKTGSATSSRRSSQESNRSRRRRRNKQGSDVRDFVPQGASFSSTAAILDVEAPEDDDTSSSGSDDPDTPEQPKPSVGGSAPAINWNKGSKRGIRITLGGRVAKAAPAADSRSSSPFEAVPKVNPGGTEKSDSPDLSERMHLSDDSDDSDSGEISEEEEGDDSIMLNLGSRPITDDDNNPADDAEATPTARIMSVKDGAGPSKKEAFDMFSKCYPVAPVELSDLERDDLETVARLFFYDRNINEIDLRLPVACTECFQEGHLAQVCPSKECVHCGAWNHHQDIFCPQWRRCQRCRARGHDVEQCESLLKAPVGEIPCDMCGSAEHLEHDCDLMWKLPQRTVTAAAAAAAPDTVLVSVSCSHCTSNRHLLGDCPSLPKPLLSSSWTLKGVDPTSITNLNSVVGFGRGMKIRGRADPTDRRSASSGSEDNLVIGGGGGGNRHQQDRRKQQQFPPRGGNNNNRNNSNIRISSGIGRGKHLAPAPQDSYRDRQPQEFFGNHTRQRSLSPNPRPVRGGGQSTRGKDRWQPPPPSRPARGGRGGGSAQRGKRGGGNGDGYRPMPSAAKKAWEKYRY